MFLCCSFCFVHRALEPIGLFPIQPCVYGLRASTAARYNVTGARRRASPFKVFAMWFTWTSILLVSCALVAGDEATGPVATTRAPVRTLDRQAAELAWKSWLQSPESGNQNAPPRRITTKSLFITPLVCPKGQRLDRNGCVQVVTINKDEHERNLLEELNALFTSAPSGDFNNYDYGDEEPGPLQLSIPIGLDPQAAPFQGQEPSAQAQELQPNFAKVDKKDGNKPDNDASIEAELELLKLQQYHNQHNDTAPDGTNILSHNVLTNLVPFPEKPKRDSPMLNETEIQAINNQTADEGQKELIYGHVDIDPILYNTESQQTEKAKVDDNDSLPIQNNTTSTNNTINENVTSSTVNSSDTLSKSVTEISNSSVHVLENDGDKTKLNPENDYSDIGEAIKLISRYAEVTTDDNFGKDQKKFASNDDSILGTRTKLQHRRNKPKQTGDTVQMPSEIYKDMLPKNAAYFRYPWPNQYTQTPPPDYPFRHLQDYWPGRNKIGGVYNIHENPRRHHHSYPHNFRPHPYAGFPVVQDAYPEQLKGYIHRLAQHHADASRSHASNQDLYSLLGLRHWFSSDGASKR